MSVFQKCCLNYHQIFILVNLTYITVSWNSSSTFLEHFFFELKNDEISANEINFGLASSRRKSIHKERREQKHEMKHADRSGSGSMKVAGQINSHVAGRRKHKAHKGLRTMQTSATTFRAHHSDKTNKGTGSSSLPEAPSSSKLRLASKTLSEDIDLIHTETGSQLGFHGIRHGVDM